MAVDPAIMKQAMELQNQPDVYFGDDPEAPIQVQTPDGQIIDASPEQLAAEGLAFAYRDMGKNHPIRPLHSAADLERGLDENKMTRAQLEEQKMNEKAGYPSNLDEAQKVKELEGKVANIENGIGTILQHLQNGQSSPASVPQPVVTGGSQVSPVVNPTQMPGPSATVIPPSPPSTDFVESSEPENRQPQQRQVTLSDGRKISVPQTSSRAMGLGPASDPAPVQQDEEVVNALEDDWADEPVAEAAPPIEPPAPDPKLEQTQQLVQEVVTFMQANDVHRFWRRHLARNVHRHVGYSGWPKPLQEEFDKRFQGFLNDPQFITTICRKIVSMEFGPALGVKWVCSFITAAAGFTAFTLCGLDG